MQRHTLRLSQQKHPCYCSMLCYVHLGAEYLAGNPNYGIIMLLIILLFCMVVYSTPAQIEDITR